MEIPNGYLNPIFSRLDKKESEKRIGKKPGIFHSLFNRTSTEHAQESLSLDEALSNESLESLLDSLHSCGDSLKDNPTHDALVAYKSAVKRFVKYAVAKSLKVEKAMSGKGVKKKNMYYLVSIIDQSLEKLAVEILGNQKDKFEILRRLDEINGLLVDLLS